MKQLWKVHHCIACGEYRTNTYIRAESVFIPKGADNVVVADGIRIAMPDWIISVDVCNEREAGEELSKQQAGCVL